jgi:hypothetical protein
VNHNIVVYSYIQIDAGAESRLRGSPVTRTGCCCSTLLATWPAGKPCLSKMLQRHCASRKLLLRSPIQMTFQRVFASEPPRAAIIIDINTHGAWLLSVGPRLYHQPPSTAAQRKRCDAHSSCWSLLYSYHRKMIGRS